MRGLLLLAVMCMGLAGASVYHISACGSYAGSSNNDDFVIDGDIYSNSGSTVTNGSCVFIRNDGSDTIYGNNFRIIQNGSSAVNGLMLVHVDATSIADSTNGSLGIVGFVNGLNFVWGMADQIAYGFYFEYYNVTNGIYLNGTDAVECNMSLVTTKPFYGCNVSYAIGGNGLASVFYDPPNRLMNFYNASGCSILDVHNSDSTLSSDSNGIGGFYADSAFSMDFDITVLRAAISNNGTRIFSMPSFEMNSSNASSYKYFNFKTINIGSDIPMSNGTVNATIDGYYCPSSSFCNHLWLSNYTAFPFYIRIPTEGLYTVPLDVSADELYIYQVVGTVEYLVFSDYAPYSKQCQSNTKICTYLVNGGQYHVRTVTGGLATDTYTQVQCATSDICYLTGFSGNIPDVVVYTQTGSCSQVNDTASKCIYYTDNPNGTSYNWTMRMYRLNDTALACESNATGAVGTLYCNMPTAVSATVLLYVNNGTTAITGSFHSANAVSMSQMWLLFYVAAALALVYVSTSIPIIMSLAEIGLTFAFWSAGVLPDNIMGIIFLGWLGVFFIFVFGSFKKDSKAG